MAIKMLSVCEGDVSSGLIGNIFASVAEWESEVNGQRTKDAMTQKFREGWWPGWAPLGYKNVRDENDKGIILVDPEIAPLIILAFKLYAKGIYSLVKLITILHKKGLRTRNGKPLAHSTMQQILSNTFYYGLMKWGKPIKMTQMGNHKPLVSKKLFDVCRIIATKNGNYATRERKYDFLLRGLLVCGECGKYLTAQWRFNLNSKKRENIAYYRCQKRKPCKQAYIESGEMEKQVYTQLKRIKFTKGFTDALTRKVKKYLKNRDKEEAKVRRGLLNKRNKLSAKRKVLENRLLDETIDRYIFKRVHDELQSDISNIDEELSKLESSRKFNFDLLEEVLAMTRNIPKTYQEAPQFLKKKYLYFFFESITILDKNIENTRYSPLVKELINQQQVILRTNWLRWLDSNQRLFA